MTKDEFLLRFSIFQPLSSIKNYQYSGKLTEAAVLVVLIETEENGKLEVLLTKRASHLKHHPSQISFPGGKAEKEDQSLIDTALRETYEEIGIPPDKLTVIGQLSPYHTVSGFDVTPIIALSSAPHTYQIDTNEVEEVFHVPLEHFIKTEHHHVFSVVRKKLHHNVHFYPYKGKNIWGATAVILNDLATQLV